MATPAREAAEEALVTTPGAGAAETLNWGSDRSGDTRIVTEECVSGWAWDRGGASRAMFQSRVTEETVGNMAVLELLSQEIQGTGAWGVVAGAHGTGAGAQGLRAQVQVHGRVGGKEGLPGRSRSTEQRKSL